MKTKKAIELENQIGPLPTSEPCFACDKPMGKTPHLVDTRDDQTVFVGSGCYKKIVKAGATGYQPPIGGPRLYLLD